MHLRLKTWKYILFFFLSFLINTFGQELSSEKFHKIGIQIGYGSQDFLEVDYSYQVCYFQTQYFYSLHSSADWSFELNFQPQINFTRYKKKDFSSEISNGYEVGLNFGIVVRKIIIDKLFWIYVLLGVGPHYISGAPERQTSGFIFSDNFLFGFNFKITQNFYFDFRTGIRHISNADIKQPNCGINNLVITSGFFFTL